MARASTGQFRRSHGHAKPGSNSRAYMAWRSMKKLCLVPTAKEYESYGGRGITICERWLKFENFLSDMGNPPDGKSLDRIDNDGNYEPANCRWATPAQQQSNTRTAKRYTHDGVTLCRSEWERRLGLFTGALTNRLKAGWSLERALTTRKS
jgi:hypothetical protein